MRAGFLQSLAWQLPGSYEAVGALDQSPVDSFSSKGILGVRLEIAA